MDIRKCTFNLMCDDCICWIISIKLCMVSLHIGLLDDPKQLSLRLAECLLVAKSFKVMTGIWLLFPTIVRNRKVIEQLQK